MDIGNRKSEFHAQLKKLDHSMDVIKEDDGIDLNDDEDDSVLNCCLESQESISEALDTALKPPVTVLKGKKNKFSSETTFTSTPKHQNVLSQITKPQSSTPNTVSEMSVELEASITSEMESVIETCAANLSQISITESTSTKDPQLDKRPSADIGESKKSGKSSLSSVACFNSNSNNSSGSLSSTVVMPMKDDSSGYCSEQFSRDSNPISCGNSPNTNISDHSTPLTNEELKSKNAFHRKYSSGVSFQIIGLGNLISSTPKTNKDSIDKLQSETAKDKCEDATLREESNLNETNLCLFTLDEIYDDDSEHDVCKTRDLENLQNESQKHVILTAMIDESGDSLTKSNKLEEKRVTPVVPSEDTDESERQNREDAKRKMLELADEYADESIDVNDPAWESMRCLTTDEERYEAVKTCWNSKTVPNPHRDLSHHSYRLRRLEREGFESQETSKRKRMATSEPEEKTMNKRHKRTESVPCTEFVDRKLNCARKNFENRNEEQLKSFTLQLCKVNVENQEQRSNLLKQYDKRLFELNVNYSPITCSRLTSNLNTWLQSRRQSLRDTEVRKVEIVTKKHFYAKNQLFRDYTNAVTKLKKVREEVERFNQFYCGLIGLDPTILRGKRITEAERMDEMYRAYEDFYRG